MTSLLREMLDKFKGTDTEVAQATNGTGAGIGAREHSTREQVRISETGKMVPTNERKNGHRGPLRGKAGKVRRTSVIVGANPD